MKHKVKNIYFVGVLTRGTKSSSRSGRQAAALEENAGERHAA